MSADEGPDFDELVVTHHATGKPVVRVGFMMRLFLRDGHLPEVRHRIVDVVSDFADQAGSGNVSLFQKNMANRMSRIGDRDLAAYLHREVDTLDPEHDYYGPHVSDDERPPSWQGHALLQPDPGGYPDQVDMSYLELAIPAELAARRPDDLVRRLLKWCQLTRPLHGTGGFAPVFAIGDSNNRPDETWPLLSRYPGLDFVGGFVMAARGVNQISGVNWLTILGTTMIDEIGGLPALNARLDDAVDHFQATPTQAPVIHPFDGGVMICAGEAPDLGDRHQGGIPNSYRVVARALRPWLFTGYLDKPTRVIKVPAPLDPFTETIRWVTRFDEDSSG